MAFEPVYEEVKFNSMRRLCQTQAVVEARLLPQPNVVIARVLSISCDAEVAASEVFTGEARYSGRVAFKVLFLDADGKNHALDYTADFNDKIVHDRITANLTAHFSAFVLDTDIVSVSGSEIKLASVVEIMLDAEITEDTRLLSSGGEGVYTHEEPIEYAQKVYGGSYALNLAETLSDVKISKVHVSESRVCLYKKETGVDSVTVTGCVITDICGETEDGLLAGYRLCTEFSEELSAADARPNDVAVVSHTLNARVTLDGEDDTYFIAAEYVLNLNYSVYGSRKTDAVIDAFSVTNELLTDTASVEIARPVEGLTVRDRVEGSVTLEVNMPIVDNILCATAFKVNLTNLVAGDGEAVVEGIVGGNIVYYSAETNSKNSVAVELPFSLTLRADGLMPGDELTGVGIVTDAPVKIRRGNEIDIRADIAVELAAVRKKQYALIVNLTEGEARYLPDSAISIHIARQKETLWDVARALSTTPELVLLQNPNLSLPLSGGERIIAYRHLGK